MPSPRYNTRFSDDTEAMAADCLAIRRDFQTTVDIYGITARREAPAPADQSTFVAVPTKTTYLSSDLDPRGEPASGALAGEDAAADRSDDTR
jgi:hypothetical protein